MVTRDVGTSLDIRGDHPVAAFGLLWAIAGQHAAEGVQSASVADMLVSGPAKITPIHLGGRHAKSNCRSAAAGDYGSSLSRGSLPASSKSTARGDWIRASETCCPVARLRRRRTGFLKLRHCPSRPGRSSPPRRSMNYTPPPNGSSRAEPFFWPTAEARATPRPTRTKNL